MTVICWDGKTLAADKLCADNWTVRKVTKISRVPVFGSEYLIGGAGDSDRVRVLALWFSAGADRESFPGHLREADSMLLAIGRCGEALLYNREPEPIILDVGIHAIGSGAEAALAAMHCGKTAREAVEIASLFCRGVGLGVDTLEFE